MQDMAAVAILAGLILAALTVAHYWLQDKWREYQHGMNRCACGLFSLTDIEAQHTSVAVHERTRCFPKTEWVAR